MPSFQFSGRSGEIFELKFDQLFAEVFTLEKADEGLRRGGQTFGNRFAEFQFAGRDQPAQLGQSLRPEFHVFRHDEAL